MGIEVCDNFLSFEKGPPFAQVGKTMPMSNLGYTQIS